jgi:tRNA threonylcarbamoyl adenosine modification protein YjeE
MTPRLTIATISSLEDLTAFSADFLKGCPRGAIVGLSGPLGAGKTTFVKECVTCLAGTHKAPKVASPSFVIHQSYALQNVTVDHFDLYRMNDLDENALAELGYFECTQKNMNFVFVEWCERVKDPNLLALTHLISIDLEETRRVFQTTRITGFF